MAKKLKKSTFGVKETEDKNVQMFLRLIEDNIANTEKNERDIKNEMIRELFREGFEVSNPSGTKKLGSKVIQQCIWRVMSKIKFLSYEVHGTGKDEDTEHVVAEGISTVCDRGALNTVFSSKGGVFHNSFVYGDGYFLFGKGENDDNPISFRVIRNEDIYTDSYAMGIRGVRPANKLVVIFAFSKDEAYDLWPELEKNEIYGRIPGSYTISDEDEEPDDILEVAWGFCLSKRTQTIFAGAQAYKIDEFSGDEYPFVKNGKPYIPVFQFMCQPSLEGFSNYGIVDMVFDLAIMTRRLLNAEIGHVEDNVYPLTLINAPQAKVDELIEKMAMAYKVRNAGGKPVVAMEFDPNGGQASVGAQTLTTQNLSNEWQMLWDRLYHEISRLGINVDDADRGTGYTRGQIISEEESSNAFIKQMMDYNATETQELMECIIDGIKEFVSTKNKSPLNLTTRIRLKDGAMARLDTEITLGALAAELKSGNYFVVVDRRSGAAKSDLLKTLHLESQLQITQPGTPEYNELYRQIAYMRNLDLEASQPQMPATAATQAPQAQQGEVQQIPAETQRIVAPMIAGPNQPL